MKTLLFWNAMIWGLLLGSPLHAQTSQFSDQSTIYQLYIGEFDKQADTKQFDRLRKLGFIRYFSIADESKYTSQAQSPDTRRVYIGPYIGQLTAEAAMARAWELGFRDAKIEVNTNYLAQEKYKDLSYSLQLGAFENPDMRKFEEIASLPAHGVFLMYEDGFFKVLSGMYRPDEVAYLKRTMIPYLRDMGYYGFVRSFRQPIGLRAAD